VRDLNYQLKQLGRNNSHPIDALALEIRAWAEYREELKAKMIAILEDEAQAARERAPLVRGSTHRTRPLEPATTH